MLIILIASAACLATLIGGSFAIRFRDKLHLVLGFSAGAIVGVALFDLLPESIELGTKHHESATLALFVALGFLVYLALDRLMLLRTHDESETALNMPRGILGALMLSIHSFLDGVAIGIGFQASTAIGIIVAVAVLVHDFSDGINTASLILRNGGTWKTAFRWLLVDAIAPILGAASTLLLRIPNETIGLVLAVFVGSFLYIGASDLIPESYHRHPRIGTTLMTFLGAAVMYVAVHFAGG
jgi:ZIP family zinc transporter